MTAPLKVLEVPFAVIATILERADVLAQATDLESGRGTRRVGRDNFSHRRRVAA